MKGFLVAAVASLALSSCVVQSNIGDQIRDGGVVYTGADVRHPVDGKVYRTPDMNMYDDVYVRAPEVTYTKYTPCFAVKKDFKRQAEARDVRVTGNTVVVQAIAYKNKPEFFRQKLNRMPAGVTAAPAQSVKDNSVEAYGEISKTEIGWGRKAAAAPFDYFLDPVFTGVGTVGASVGWAVYSPFKWMWDKWVSPKDEK